MIIYTRDGVPINRSGDDLFDASGKQVARLERDKAFAPNGSYVATLANDRLIFFVNDSQQTGSKFNPKTVTGFSETNIAGFSTYGDEPEFVH